MSVVDVPVCLRPRGWRVVVVGGGAVGSARALTLLEAEADVIVVAPRLDESLERLARDGGQHRLTLVRREAIASDFDAARLVYLAIDNALTTRLLAEEARRRGALVNAADQPDLCDFTLPAVGRRGPITVAVSTSGLAPAVARLIRASVTRALRHEHVQLIRIVQALRRALPAGPQRMSTIRSIVDGDVGGLVISGQRHAAFVALRAHLSTHSSPGEST